MSHFKQIFILTILLTIAEFQIFSQQEEKIFTPSAEIFTDFHFSITDNTHKPEFSITRAYFGGDFLKEGRFSGSIILNMAKLFDSIPHEGNNSPIREVSIGYDNGKLKIRMGVTGTRIMIYQIRFYDKRYVANTFQSINKYGSLYDLGIAIDYNFNNRTGIDFTLMNGGGVAINDHGSLKASLGFNYFPANDAILRVYCDTRKIAGIWQSTFIGFGGFTWNVFKIGGEFNYRTNHDNTRGHNVWGFSATGSVNLTDKLQLFGRYDYSSSVVLPGEIIEWNYKNDHQLIVFGLQHTFIPGVRIAIDYQGKIPADPSESASDMFFIHLHYRY